MDMLNTTTKNTMIAVVVVTLGSVLALAQQVTPRDEARPVTQQSLTGTVTCSARITHQYSCQRNQTLQSCTWACVQRGSDYVLAVGDTHYILDGDHRGLERFAGGAATVEGVVANNRIQVKAIYDAKSSDARGGQ